ncbi:MAG: formate dehydrogenase accessory sulfurtransferase FdhD [Bacteroidota bacterium]
MTSSVSPTTLIKVESGKVRDEQDILAVEEPLEIRIGFGPKQEREQKSLAVTMRTPGYDLELSLGFLYSEGIIQNFEQVKSIEHCEDLGRQEEAGNVVRVELTSDLSFDLKRLQRNFYTTSSCGVCGKTSIEAVEQACQVHSAAKIELSEYLIHELPEMLRKAQRVFNHTGGLHASGLFDADGELQLVREDVGRHNALDKLIGAAVFQGQIPLNEHVVVLSGRISFELVQKAMMAGLPIIVAVGAPSSLAVDLAKKADITLVGFTRESRFNVYTGKDRISFQSDR